jgi:hypothetical protein
MGPKQLLRKNGFLQDIEAVRELDWPGIYPPTEMGEVFGK